MKLNVSSSWVRSVAKVNKDLVVECRNGNTYVYLNVPNEVFFGLLDTNSIGSYLNDRVIGRYECFKKVD